MTRFNVKHYTFVILILFPTISFVTSAKALFSNENKVKEYNIRVVLPPDKIPAIRHPEFVSAHKAGIHPDEPVVGLTINGDNRAYSVYLLNSHEIVNDVVGGEPVAVAWCPFANLAVVYSRVIEDNVYTFGVSGKLVKNTLIMFDYETESLWTAISGESIRGDMEGERLKEVISAQKITWGEWQRLHPDTKVLTYRRRQTAGYDNYRDYHKSGLKTGILPVENRDDRLKVKSTVIGLDINGKQKAYPLDLFKKTKIVSNDFQGLSLLLYHDNSTNNTVVYNRKLGENVFEFNMAKSPFFDRNATDIAVDNLTGTKWDLKTGKAIEGNLGGQVLERVHFRNVYWFIWADYYPDSEIYK